MRSEELKENWENLANAIVVFAAQDFKKAYKRYLRNSRSREAAGEVEALIRFFMGDYYKALTSVDGEVLVRELKRQVEEKINAEKREPTSVSDLL